MALSSLSKRKPDARTIQEYLNDHQVCTDVCINFIKHIFLSDKDALKEIFIRVPERSYLFFIKYTMNKFDRELFKKLLYSIPVESVNLDSESFYINLLRACIDDSEYELISVILKHFKKYVTKDYNKSLTVVLRYFLTHDNVSFSMKKYYLHLFIDVYRYNHDDLLRSIKHMHNYIFKHKKIFNYFLMHFCVKLAQKSILELTGEYMQDMYYLREKNMSKDAIIFCHYILKCNDKIMRKLDKNW